MMTQWQSVYPGIALNIRIWHTRYKCTDGIVFRIWFCLYWSMYDFLLFEGVNHLFWIVFNILRISNCEWHTTNTLSLHTFKNLYNYILLWILMTSVIFVHIIIAFCIHGWHNSNGLHGEFLKRIMWDEMYTRNLLIEKWWKFYDKEHNQWSDCTNLYWKNAICIMYLTSI